MIILNVADAFALPVPNNLSSSVPNFRCMQAYDLL
jgi:hypothetical protein